MAETSAGPAEDPAALRVVAARAAVIESGFGVLWFGWGQQQPPVWLAVLLVVGAVACVVVVVLGVVLLRRLPAPTGPPPAGAGRRYWTVVGLEAVAAFGGAVALGRLGRPELIAAWVCVVVGLHFLPLSSLYLRRGFVVLGCALVLVGLLAGLVTLATGATSATVAGPGAGLCLLVHAALLLRTVRGRTAQASSP